MKCWLGVTVVYTTHYIVWLFPCRHANRKSYSGQMPAERALAHIAADFVPSHHPKTYISFSTSLPNPQSHQCLHIMLDPNPKLFFRGGEIMAVISAIFLPKIIKKKSLSHLFLEYVNNESPIIKSAERVHDIDGRF